jgi:hypothetical protein
MRQNGYAGYEQGSTEMNMTRNVAYAAAVDFANKRMRKAGRKAWSVGDYRAACEKFAELMKLVVQ